MSTHNEKKDNSAKLSDMVLEPGLEFVLNQLDFGSGHAFFGYVLQQKGRAFVAEFHLGDDDDLKLEKGQRVAIKCNINRQPYALSAVVQEASEQRIAGTQTEPNRGTVPATGNRRIIAEFEIDGMLEQNQRREFFRLPINTYVYYKPLPSLEDARGVAQDIRSKIQMPVVRGRYAGSNSLDDDTSFKKVKTIDLSGGGLRCKLPAGPLVGDRMELRIVLGQNDIVPVVARVARVQELLAPGQFDVSFAFEDVHDAIRERIVRFVFAEQMKVVRRERSMRGML